MEGEPNISGQTTGNITAQNLNLSTGTPTAGSFVGFYGFNNIGSVTIQVQGTWTGSLIPQITVDGINWISMGPNSLINQGTGVYSASIPSASVGVYECGSASFQGFRLTASGAFTGTAVATLIPESSASTVSLDNSLPPGTNNIGTTGPTLVAAPQMGQTTVNTAQVQLTATSYVPSNYILVSAPSGNSAPIFIGKTGVTATTGLAINAGAQPIAIPASNANILYIISAASTTDKLTWLVC